MGTSTESTGVVVAVEADKMASIADPILRNPVIPRRENFGRFPYSKPVCLFAAIPGFPSPV